MQDGFMAFSHIRGGVPSMEVEIYFVTIFFPRTWDVSAASQKRLTAQGVLPTYVGVFLKLNYDIPY